MRKKGRKHSSQSFYCENSLIDLLGRAARKRGVSKSILIQEALQRYFASFCRACNGTGRTISVEEQVDVTQLVKTLEDFLGPVPTGVGKKEEPQGE